MYGYDRYYEHALEHRMVVVLYARLLAENCRIGTWILEGCPGILISSSSISQAVLHPFLLNVLLSRPYFFSVVFVNLLRI